MTRQDDTFRSLPRPAQLFIGGLTACALAALVLSMHASWAPLRSPALLGLLAVLCAAGAALEIFAPGDYKLQPNFAAFFWGAVLLPPWAIVLLAAACFCPEWLLRRAPGYKTLFNVVNYVLVGLVVNAFGSVGGIAKPGLDLAAVAAMGVAATVGALVNHLLIVVVVAYAGKQPLRSRMPQITDGLPLSVGVGMVGATLAVLWEVGPAAPLVAIGCVALMYRALAVPMLRHQADTDAKTGLYHSERFREELVAQLESAARRPGACVAVAMVDLDHLRVINTRCGHLAGDRAIRAVADALAELASRHGAAGRFGGEEFALVLPGLTAQEARVALDDVRLRLRAFEFREGEAGGDLRVSFSAGLAVFPDHGESPDELLAAADVALYDAKAAGRDRVRIALSAASRELLAVMPPAAAGAGAPAGDARTDQPLPATAGSVLATTGARLLRRPRSGDRRTTEAIRRELDDTRELLARMQQSHLHTILSFARAAEDKDPYRQGSTDRVAAIAVKLSRELGFSTPELRAIALGAALRDIGTVGVRDATLLKGGRLDQSELEEVRRHTDLASRLLADLELPVVVKQMVRSHHEHWDGSGYPDGLAGEEIPLGARILAVADALDAMLSPRPYREPMGALAAHAEIARGAGRQFCPEVVAALGRSGGDPGWTATLADERVSRDVIGALWTAAG
jgi:diguanylate cyclase (GGDEF)-like protein